MEKKIRSVADGYQPWEALYDLVKYRPDLLKFAIGNLVAIEDSLLYNLKKWCRLFDDDASLIIRYKGGELLTRCRDKDILPDCFIGAAFDKMPRSKMAEIFPILLEIQINSRRGLRNEDYSHYSINLEGAGNDMRAWEKVVSLIDDCKDLSIRFEVKESELLSIDVMQMLRAACLKNNIGIYIDDLCADMHDLLIEAQRNYMSTLVKELCECIIAVKIDYRIMRKLDEGSFSIIESNLIHFKKIWNENAFLPMPTIIYESMPTEKTTWLKILGDLALDYGGFYFQTG